MKLHAPSMAELVKSYRYSKNPDEKTSTNLADTVVNIIDALVVLLRRENACIDKITVKDVAAKAGYSRTTFYVHFCDVYDVMQTLEDMLIYHLGLNSEIYYLLFLDELHKDAVKEVYNMLNHYGKYVLLLLRDAEFMQRYKAKFISVITQKMENTGDIRKLYYARICASAMIESYMFWLEHQDSISYNIIVKTSNKIAEATIYSDESIW